MRVECTQCGGVLDIRGPGSLARCSWCGALSRFSWEGGVFFHEPALDGEKVARLFPPGKVLQPSLMWFPYVLHGSRLGKAFSQPYPALDDYVPPSGELRPWPEGGDPRGETVPSECLEGRLVYHPFYSVTITATGEGMLLDGVSGRVPGHGEPVGSGGPDFEGIFFRSLLAGILPSIVFYLSLRSISPVLAVIVSACAGYWAATFIGRRRAGE